VLDLNGTNQTIAGLTQIQQSTPSRVVNRLPGTRSTLTINNPTDLTYAGNLQDGGGTFALSKLGPGIQTLSGMNTYTGGTNVAGGKLVFASAASVAAGSLEVTGGQAVFAPGMPIAPTITSLVITSPGSVDLTNDDLVIDYASASPLSAVRLMLADARLFSSLATPTTRIGYSDNSNSMLLKYTYAGDANLDGQVDVTDLGSLATNWQAPGIWTSGDFNYDGFIDVTDLGLLATTWQLGVGSPLAVSLTDALASVGLSATSVPEPATIVGWTFIASLTSMRRRARA
jgi:autotransporter-associated beta strand protein